MGVISGSVLIRRPPEQVYDLSWRPERATEWIVGMVGTGKIRPGDPETGLDYRFEWTYKMLGLTYRGENHIAKAERPHRLSEESSGDLTSKWDWRFESDGEGTRVDLVIAYTPPMGWLGRLLDPLILKPLNQRALDGTLANLKSLLEEDL